MIFVTVGTHEQQFNRLIEYVDELVNNNIIDEEVIIQSGFSTYKPINCTTTKLIPYDEMNENIRKARIIITHGGPASFIQVLQAGKVPIVVPRQVKYDEHVNDHQVEFVKAVYERYNNIIPVYDINNLKECIEKYDSMIQDLNTNIINNNKKFNDSLERIVNQLI